MRLVVNMSIICNVDERSSNEVMGAEVILVKVSVEILQTLWSFTG